MTEYITCMTTWRKVRREAKVCDIIEFSRTTYSHFAFYIGDGICVHVLDREEGDKGAGGLARKCAMTIEEIANGHPCRINNLEGACFWQKVGGFKNIRKRTPASALQMALSDIILNSSRQPLLGREYGIDVPYNLLGCNCEAYACHWRYVAPVGGFSQQGYNSIFGTILGTTQRVLDKAALGYCQIVRGRDISVPLRVAAGAGAGLMKGSAITVGLAKSITDGATGILAGLGGGIRRLVR